MESSNSAAAAHPDRAGGTESSNPNLITTTLTGRSLLTRVLQPILRLFRPRLVRPGPPVAPGSPKLSPPHISAKTVERQLESIYLYDFYPSAVSINAIAPAGKHHLYYFAGGGFQSPPSKEHWKLCAELCNRLDNEYRVTLVSYPLAPNSPAAASLPSCQQLLTTIFREARTNSTSVTLAGDSAGANVALSLALWDAQVMIAENREKTGALKNVLVISPPCDLRNTNPEIDEADRHDPVLTRGLIEDVASKWAGIIPRHDPTLSPVLADIGSLKRINVKVHGVVGTYDLLAPDAMVFKELCSKNGVDGEWLVWERQMHCFPLAFAYGLPEGKKGVQWIVDTLRKNA